MKALIRALLSAIIAIPLSIIAFAVVAIVLIVRTPDDSPFLDGGDDGPDPLA